MHLWVKHLNWILADEIAASLRTEFSNIPRSSADNGVTHMECSYHTSHLTAPHLISTVRFK